MKKSLFLFLLFGACYFSAHSQVTISKMIGKNASQHKMGLGVFGNYDIPLNEIGNKSLMIELMDLEYFRGITSDNEIARAFISIKVGYRKIFSEESKTGFFIEPQLGYCRVVVATDLEPEARYGDGVAAVLETGYSLEVGQRGNALIFGLKYEADMAGKDYTIHSIGLRFSFSFSFLRRQRN